VRNNKHVFVISLECNDALKYMNSLLKIVSVLKILRG